LFALAMAFCVMASHSQTVYDDLAFHLTAYPTGDSLIGVKARTEIFPLAFSKSIPGKGKSGKVVLGYSKKKKPVEVYYFSGSSNKRALIIGGMHGSELSAIELAKQVIEILS